MANPGNKMNTKIIFMGATKFSEEMLIYLLQNKFKIEAIFTIPEEFRISYCSNKVKNYNYSRLDKIAWKHKIKQFEVDSISGKRLSDYGDIIKNMEPDVIVALGWYYMVPKKIRDLAKYGVWGIHASLLPKYAGGAPLVWAIINGEAETGVTLFRLDEGVDDGDIIAQRSFPIKFNDTISDVYGNATVHSKEILENSLVNLKKLEFMPQNKTMIEVYPQRKPEEGKIDLEKSALEIYNFVRAQTKPYPGAFSKINGKKIVFWKVQYISDIKNIVKKRNEIFEYLGKAYVKLKEGFLEVLEVNYDGNDYNFHDLAQKKRLWGKILNS